MMALFYLDYEVNHFMQVLIIRHADAENQAKTDELRPLSSKGKADMWENAQGLKQIVPQIDRIAHSPLLRAQQTAEIIAQIYLEVPMEILHPLAPGHSMTAILTYLQQQAQIAPIIALVGHEPSLGQLANWLLTGQVGQWMPLKKGAVCSLEFPNQIEVGQAILNWMFRPKQLRQLVD